MIIRTCNFLFISGLAFLILLIDIDNDIDHQDTSTITQIQLKRNDMLITTSITKLPLPLQCTGKPYLLKAQHSAFNIVDSKTIPLTVQNWQITSFVPDSTDLVLDSSNICLAVRTVGMQRCPGFHKNVSFPK